MNRAKKEKRAGIDIPRIRSRSGVISVSLLVCAVVAASAFASGPVTERVEQLLAVASSGDRPRIASYARENFTPSFLAAIPPERHAEIIHQTWETSGGFDPPLFRLLSDFEVSVLMRQRKTGGWTRLIASVEPSPPHRIEGIGINANAFPDLDAIPEQLDDGAIGERLGRYLDRLAAADRFSGTVLVAKDGEVLFKGAYGLASKRFAVPNRVDTKFNLGSMNKMFTAVATLQLAERGKLSLDDPIGKYLTDWLPEEIASKVRIKHLLTHTSGLGSYFNRRFFESSRTLYREVDDYKPLVKDEEPAFEPGTDWRYSNTGFLLLGAVIEKAGGENYFDYIREHVYRPAGMINSDAYDMDEPVPNLAMGYSRHPDDSSRWKENTFEHVVRGGPAGGGFSTVEDLLSFDRALRTHKLLSPQYTEMLWSARPEYGSAQYGYGFSVWQSPRVVGHGGGFPGISSNLLMYLDDGYTVSVLSNYSGGSFEVVHELRALIYRKISGQ